MSDEMAERVEQEKITTPESVGGRSVTLSATLHPNGQVEFSIPKNKIVAHGLVGMLSAELAKMEVFQMLAKSQDALKSRGGIDGLLKRMNGG